MTMYEALTIRDSMQDMTEDKWENHYLNSFHSKMITLCNGRQLPSQEALQQLHEGIISKEDIMDNGHDLPCKCSFYSTVFFI